MTWDICCKECLNNGICEYQENDIVEDCNRYFDYLVYYEAYPYDEDELEEEEYEI